MSARKECRLLPKIFVDNLEKEIAASVAQALRTDFPNVKSAATKLAEQVEISQESLKKWYYGHRVPSAIHLIILARSSPAIRSVLAALFQNPDETPKIHSATRCTMHSNINPKTLEKLNQRQIWFLEKLHEKENPKPEEMMKTWEISLRTAKYDIAALVDAGLIRFVGPRRNGKYLPCWIEK